MSESCLGEYNNESWLNLSLLFLIPPLFSIRENRLSERYNLRLYLSYNSFFC